VIRLIGYDQDTMLQVTGMSGDREINADPEYAVRDQQRMENAKRYFEWQFAMAERHLGARVVEAGCGLGNFTQHLAGRELVVGTDIEPRCIEGHRRRFAGRPNVMSVCVDLAAPAFLELKRYEPDSAACLNVLEHVRDDTRALANLHAVLPRDGTVVLIVPAFEALYGPIDERLGHYRRYSRRSLAQLAQRTGFQPRILRYMNMAGLLGWWWNARVLKKTEQSAGQIRFFDAAVVPVMSRVERWLEPVAGQSIFAVLVKS
jgi:2-polyprenyl-3-methyl-5-hydroxy-6-metoxy-1,4-benzoquinol methylase